MKRTLLLTILLAFCAVAAAADLKNGRPRFGIAQARLAKRPSTSPMPPPLRPSRTRAAG